MRRDDVWMSNTTHPFLKLWDVFQLLSDEFHLRIDVPELRDECLLAQRNARQRLVVHRLLPARW